MKGDSIRGGWLAAKLCVGPLIAMITVTVIADDKLVPVTVHNFIRAESDLYLDKTVKEGGFGKLNHSRELASVDNQTVVRMNRDTIYSSGVFDLGAGALTITLPETGKRFMSMQAVSEDHYTTEVVYPPGRYRYTKDEVGTRYVFIIVRTLANPQDAEDMKAAHGLQDAIQVEQDSAGKWESPKWDPESQKKVRDALAVLGSTIGDGTGIMFGTRDEVDPILHLIGTSIGWGGNPKAAAVYESVFPKSNDGKTAQKLTLKNVPVDGFWSVSVYNAKGYFEKNDLNAYSVNSLTAKPNQDGSFTIHFGGENSGANYLPIMPDWNYTVRLYRPRKEVIEGKWKLPSTQAR